MLENKIYVAVTKYFVIIELMKLKNVKEIRFNPKKTIKIRGGHLIPKTERKIRIKSDRMERFGFFILKWFPL